MKPHYINNWKTWKRLCDYYNIDPYENFEFSIAGVDGNSTDFEYTGDIPEKEE